MPQKSYGKMRGTRKKLASKGKISITRYIQKFSIGDRVNISLIPSSKIQHPRFDGRTGIVVEKRGRDYVVRIKDGSVDKNIFLRPEHLRLQK